MPPKKKGAAKSTAVVDPIITGDQALQLKGALDAGQPLDNDTLLTLLHADTPCEGLYSKTCKVRSTFSNEKNVIKQQIPCSRPPELRLFFIVSIADCTSREFTPCLRSTRGFSELRQTKFQMTCSSVGCVNIFFCLCRVQSKGRNPNCFCNLIPDPTKSRRSGLWALTTNAEKQLGPDPTATKKEDAATPAGLRNLGNTCYVNSVLQCLFANEAFRDAIYAAAPPVSDDAVVKAMR